MISTQSSLRRIFSCPGDSGFTLVEVLAAMVIFSITSLGLTLLMVSMIGGNDFANSLSQGTQLAEDKMEELKSECCLVIAAGSDTVGEYTRTWYFVDNDPVSGLIKVVVTVEWSDDEAVDEDIPNHSTTLVALMLPY